MMDDTGGLFLIASIGGERVAIPAEAIESVVEVEGVTPVPRVGAHVVGLAPLRSRVLTIVDANASLELPPSTAEGRPAVVVPLDGHGYGILVDEVEDVVAIGEPPRTPGRGLAAGWARVSSGAVEYEGQMLLLLDPSALIAGPAGLAA